MNERTCFERYASKVEEKIARRLVADALAAGYAVSVNDGEAFPVKRSHDAAVILGALASTDSDVLIFRDAAGERIGWVSLIWGNEADLISDCTDNPATLALLKGAEAVAEALAC